MAFSTQQPRPAAALSRPGTVAPRYGPALAAVTVLFFLWGFITCLNDILIPYLKAIFQLSYAQANLINFCFFGAYLVVSIPAGRLVARVGYKGGMLLGFAVAAVGCLLFYPAAASRTYGLFLGALFVLASGITLLQVAANPYVAILGPPESASARLTLTQAFNSLGTFLAPQVGTWLILSDLPKTATAGSTIDVTAVQLPYLALGGVLLLICFLLSRLALPVIVPDAATGLPADELRRAWHYPHLLWGVVGIFAYVGAEVAIGSHLVSYLQQADVRGLSAAEAGFQVKYYWGAAMVGRFLGAWLLGHIRPGRLLAANAGGAVVLVLLSISSHGALAQYSLLAVGLMNSLMFSAIFTLAVAGMGHLTEEASGLLCAAIVGGAVVPLLFGYVADANGLRWAFALPVLCYLYIGWYGLRGSRVAAPKTAITTV